MPEPTPSNGNGQSQDAEIRTLMSEIKALETNILLARTTWARQHGLSYNGGRDLYDVLGYPDIISTEDYRSMYDRGGIAGSIVDVMPDATWRGDPSMELIEDEDPEKDTEFEKTWKMLEKKHQICSKLLRVDKLSRLSSYAVLLIGATGDLEQELPKGTPDSLLYLMPFLGGGGPGARNRPMTVATGADATVFEYETDSQSPRFGLPKSYQLKRTDIASSALPRPVHWSRIIHVAEGLLDDEVFGQPALERVWNLLVDLQKVTGGGAESFWLRANQGLHMDIDKDMSLPDATAAISALKEQAEAYKHQLTRWLRTRGVKVETLGSDVANFGPNADAIITQVAGSKRIPKRILTGSELGELASSQDRENFRDQVVGRQMQYAGPYIVKPLVDRLIAYGYLPTPKKAEGYQIKWPHIQVLTEGEKADGAVKWSQTKVGEDPVFTDAEIRDHFQGMPPLTDEQRQEMEDRKMERMEKTQEIMAKSAPPEDKPATLKAAEERKFSSTQIQLPLALADALFSFGKSITAMDLCDEEGGLEDDAHITVKYGLHTNDVADVRKVLATYVGPIRITLGKTAIFEGPNYDVLYVAVDSPDLVALNRRLSDSLEVTDTHPVYQPHATVGYLKQGYGKRYVGRTNLEGMSASIGSVRFSPASGEDVDLRITGRAPEGKFAVVENRYAEDIEMLRVLTTAIEVGAMDIVERILGAVEGHPFYGNQYTEGHLTDQQTRHGIRRQKDAGRARKDFLKKHERSSEEPSNSRFITPGESRGTVHYSQGLRIELAGILASQTKDPNAFGKMLEKLGGLSDEVLEGMYRDFKPKG